MRLIAFLTVTAFLCPAALCAEELPAAVTAQIAALAPGAKVTRSEQRNRDGAPMYRLGIEAGGKRGRMEIAADGKLFWMSLDIDQAAVPAPVAAAALAMYPDAKFEEARKQSGADRQLTYEMRYRKDGLRLESFFDAAGKMLERRDEVDGKSLPEAVLNQVNLTKPGGRVTQAYRRNKDGQEYFDLEVSTNCTLTIPKSLGARTDIRNLDAAELPEAVRASAKEMVGDLKDLRFVEKTTPATTTYEVTIRDRTSLEVALDGKLLKAEGAGRNQGDPGNQGGPPGRGPGPGRPAPPAPLQSVKPPAPPPGDF